MWTLTSQLGFLLIKHSKFFRILLKRYYFIFLEQKAFSSSGTSQPTKQRPGSGATFEWYQARLSRKPSISHHNIFRKTVLVWRYVSRFSLDQTKIKGRVTCLKLRFWRWMTRNGAEWTVAVEFTCRSANTTGSPLVFTQITQRFSTFYKPRDDTKRVQCWQRISGRLRHLRKSEKEKNLIYVKDHRLVKYVKWHWAFNLSWPRNLNLTCSHFFTLENALSWLVSPCLHVQELRR